MRLFVSWSGKRSEALAQALYEWLPLVLHFVEPWLSKSDIQAGERWSIEVAKELEQSNFGILCVTRDNLASPWILFEAGALAKSMQDGRVMPVLLDLDFKEVSGPLAQFQAKKAERDGIYELVAGLNRAAPSPVPDVQLEKLFSALWSDLQKQIGEIPVSEDAAKRARPQGEILEELVAGIRNVEMRVRDIIEEEPAFRPKRRGRRQMVMLDMMELQLPDDPIRLLMIASFLRDDAPWIYELARETYVGVVDGNAKQAREAGERLLKASDALRRGPYVEDGISNRAMHFLMLETSKAISQAPVSKSQGRINAVGLGLDRGVDSHGPGRKRPVGISDKEMDE